MVDRNALSDFVSANLRLLYKFMARYQVDEEYYSTLVVRFIRTAERYLSEEKLQKYEFSTIAWLNLRSELYEIYRKENLRAPLVPLSDLDGVAAKSYELGLGELQQILEENLTDKQFATLIRRFSGHSNKEIAEQDSVSINSVEKRFIRIRKKLSKLLEELH